LASLNITGSSYTDPTSPSSPAANITQIGTTDQYSLGAGFNATDWPQVGYVLAGGSSISFDLTFRGDTIRNYGSVVTIWSTGGLPQSIILAGTMASAPIATLTVNNGSDSWVPDVTGSSFDPVDNSTVIYVGVDFGEVYPGNTTTYSKK
jgi:hypothetical protein